MSKEISYAAALANKIENDEKLKFAHNSLDKELFDRIYKSYNKAKWSQLALPIAFVILVILELIFIPTDPSSNLKLQIILIEASLFIVPILPIWLVLCDFTFGKDWRKYSKWYKKRSHPNELYLIFKENKSKK